MIGKMKTRQVRWFVIVMSFLGALAMVAGALAIPSGNAYALNSGGSQSVSVGTGAGGYGFRVQWGTGEQTVDNVVNSMNSAPPNTIHNLGPGFDSVLHDFRRAGRTTRNNLTNTVRQAYTDCENKSGKRGTCRIAFMGMLQTNDPRNWGYPCDGDCWMPAVDNHTQNQLKDHMPSNMTWTFAGQGINLNTKLNNGKTIHDYTLGLLGPQSIFVVVALSPDMLVQKGWMPEYEPLRAYDIKSMGGNTKNAALSDVTGIAEYQVSASGYDGYVKGMSTKPQSYQTPFGSLAAKANECALNPTQEGVNTWTWNGGNNTESRTFNNICSEYMVKHGYQQKVDIAVNEANKNRHDAALWAKAQSEKMTVDFNIENADGVSGQTGRDLTEAFKKGGQYKVTKHRRVQTISFLPNTMDTIKFYRRSVDVVVFKGWRECKSTDKDYYTKYGQRVNANQHHDTVISCQRIGVKDKPSINDRPAFMGRSIGWHNISILQKGSYDPWTTAPRVQDRSEWHEIPRSDAENAINNNAVWNDNGVQRKFWTAQVEQAGSNDSITLGRWYVSDNKFHWVNFPLAEKHFWTGIGTVNWEANKDKIESWYDTSAFRPVPNYMQSPVPVLMQDFVHVNCNKQDFDAYVQALSGKRTPAGLPLVDAASVKSTKYQGYFHTNPVASDNPVEVVQPLTGITKTLGAQVLTGNDNKLTNNQPATLTNFLIQWGSHTYEKGADGRTAGDIDPVYTKECPFDCVADGVASNIRKSGAPADNVANNSYGIRVWNNTNGGAVDTSKTPNANTADMTFFRNNEWNYFTVDKWVPVTGNGITYHNTPATTTTIVKAPDGTPWTKDGNQLTQMQVNNAGKWENLFSSKMSINQGAVLNQWSHSVINTFDADSSVQKAGDLTQFRIKSPWATENGKPLKFNIKWEYEADNAVTVPVSVVFGNGNGKNAASTVNTVSQDTKVDGKCDSQFHNANQQYTDHTGVAHDWTGVTRKNQPDMEWQQSPLQGWFTITFVRATAE